MHVVCLCECQKFINIEYKYCAIYAWRVMQIRKWRYTKPKAGTSQNIVTCFPLFIMFKTPCLYCHLKNMS